MNPPATVETAGAGGRVAVLDGLRGLAALAVCLFHFAGRDDFLPDGVVKESAKFGYLGVASFFVISGFVIPWVLRRAGYRLAGYGRFLVKRLVRLEPPYLVAVASSVVFLFVYSAYKGRPFPPEEGYWRHALLHLGYLVRFAGRDWFDDVYWTLGIECQFYLLMGLAFPLLAGRRAWLRWLSLVGLAALTLAGLVLPVKMYVISSMSIFLLGAAAFQLRAGLLGRRGFLVLTAGLGALTYGCLSLPIALVAVATALVVAFVDFSHPVLDRLGAMSYSLYLFHTTLGSAVINLGKKYTDSAAGRYVVLGLALGAAFLLAWVVYRLVELPARRWSSRIGYHAPGSARRAAATASAAADPIPLTEGLPSPAR